MCWASEKKKHSDLPCDPPVVLSAQLTPTSCYYCLDSLTKDPLPPALLLHPLLHHSFLEALHRHLKVLGLTLMVAHGSQLNT